MAGYLDWPGVAQVFRLARPWREGGHQSAARLRDYAQHPGPALALLLDPPRARA